MGRLLDALIGPPEVRPTIEARAGTVALAPGGTNPGGAGRAPYGRGPGLAPIEWAGAGVPWWDRTGAMSLPTISRCRDLICSAVSVLPFTAWSVDQTVAPPVETRRPPPPWTLRPDPDRTRQWILAWTTDDLFFYGEAHWQITARYAGNDDYPMAFRRICPGELGVDDYGQATVNGQPVNPRDVVEFLSPIEGLLANGYRALSIALALDDAADRFAGTEIPAGVLQEQPGGEDLSSDDLTTIAGTFSDARRANTVAALNKYMSYIPTIVDASAMQLVEGRTYQALELARLGNVPAYLVGAPAGTGMTYLNAEQSRQDLLDYGALPYISCIEQTLSGPNVTPNPMALRLDTNAWLRSPFTPGTASPTDIGLAVDPNQQPVVP